MGSQPATRGRTTRDQCEKSNVAKMLTDPLSKVPQDWRLIRYLVVASAVTGFGMFFVYALHFMVSYWPF